MVAPTAPPLALTRWAVNRAGAGAGSRVQEQIGLFEHIPAPEPHPVLEELREVDVSTTTPMEALAKLDEWRKRMMESEGDEDKA